MHFFSGVRSVWPLQVETAKRVLYLSAETPAEQARWVQVIRLQRKGGLSCSKTVPFFSETVPFLAVLLQGILHNVALAKQPAARGGGAAGTT